MEAPEPRALRVLDPDPKRAEPGKGPGGLVAAKEEVHDRTWDHVADVLATREAGEGHAHCPARRSEDGTLAGKYKPCLES